MENLIIEATEYGPEIRLDASGTISIHGKSMMEDASLYYSVCQNWVKEYLQKNIGLITVEIDLSYFNSSSAKQLMKLLMTIDESETKGQVIWVYPKGNDVLLERGQELEIMLDLPFQYRAK